MNPTSIPAPSSDANQEPVVVTGKPSGGWKNIVSTILILVAAPLVALFLTAFVFQSYEVDGMSMHSTLQDKDRLIIWKVPRTLSRVTHHTYVPHREDVVVFVKHGLYESGSTQEKQLIKRVIGLPGDRVVVQDGVITVYNSEHPSGYNPDLNHDFTQNIDVPTPGSVDLIVPEGELFVCGDNRGNSLDSRSFGTVPAQDVIGKLTVRIFPVNKFKSFI